jgi:Glycosyl hydrolase family 79 C-terminal beta domain
VIPADRGRRAHLLTLLGGIVVIVAVSSALIGAGDPSQTIPRDALPVVVASTPQGPPVPSGYVGLSLETELAPVYFGLDSPAVNPMFVKLVSAVGSGRPVLRIGGTSTDWTWWRMPRLPRPAGIRYTLSPRWLQIVNATATALHARLILGVNFEADSRAVAAAESQAYLRGISRSDIEGLEFGNEPELYNVFAWYRRNARKVLGRPLTYHFDSYLRDYAIVSSVLPRSVWLVGPHFHGGWFPNLDRYLSAFPRVQVATLHRYPLLRCGTRPGSPIYPTIPNLLAARSTVGLAASVAPLAAVAHAHGALFRLDEFNSVACRGKRGVSDTFASALWVLDTLFGLAHVGVDGINVHTSENGAYDPFTFNRSAGHWFAQVKPIYYGLLMFARAAPPGSRLLATTHPAEPALRTWATLAPDRTVRVVLINDSPDRSATLTIRAPFGATTTARLTRLLAPGLAATTDLTLAGQTFGTRTATANPTGAFKAATVAPIKRRYVITLPAASAALLTVPGH